MKKSALKSLNLHVESLSREQIKKIRGGQDVGHLEPVCYRCCPDDPCSRILIYCLDVLCPVLS